MKLVILTQYYPPEIGAPQARLSALAAHLVERGHDVTVLTAMPNYPTGKIFSGYGGVWKREMRDGVRIVRTWIYPTQKADYVRRLANYFSFVLSSALLGLPAFRSADFVMVESPPLFLGLSAYWLALVKRARVIFNVSDLWPDSLITLGMLTRQHPAYRLSARLEALFYRRAWLVSGQTKGIVADIQRRFPRVATFHLSNGVDVRQFAPDKSTEAARSTLTESGEFVVIYAGLHGLAQGLGQAIEAAKRLRDVEGIRFVLIGDGPEKAQLIAQAAGLNNITFLDPRPFGEIPALLASADAILVPLKLDIPEATPSKLYEAMASGKPVILVALGEAAEIVRRHDAGVIVAPADIDGLVSAVQTLRADPERGATLGANGRRAAETDYDRVRFIDRFLDYLMSHKR
jgi:glycosyltransferase involved in cell wall biosynthesis